jgi:hypothetical protein
LTELFQINNCKGDSKWDKQDLSKKNSKWGQNMGGKKDDKSSEWADNGKCKSIFSFFIT